MVLLGCQLSSKETVLNPVGESRHKRVDCIPFFGPSQVVGKYLHNMAKVNGSSVSDSRMSQYFQVVLRLSSHDFAADRDEETSEAS